MSPAGHVAAGVAGSAVIVQFGALRGRQACLGVEPVRAPYSLPLDKHPAVQPLGDEYGRLGLAAVQDGERREA